MKTELIKWMCEYADGFEWLNSRSSVRLMNNAMIYPVPVLLANSIVYPLLLQRAIEGVNKAGKDCILKTDIEIDVWYLPKWGWSFDISYPDENQFTPDGYFGTPDDAKRSALEYVRQQELSS